MCGLLPPLAVPCMLKLLCVLQVLARSNFSIVSLCIMQLCEYVLPIGIPLHVPKIGFWGVLRVKMWKYCVLTPKRHYPAWIRVCWCIAFQNRFNSLSSRSVKRFCIQRNSKKLSGNFGYMGRSNPRAILTKCDMLGDMINIIRCAIFRDCRLRGVGVVRGVTLPSPVDSRCRPYNTGHTTIWRCDWASDITK